MIRAALLACFMASPAIACDEYVFHVGSYHSDREFIPDVNETNPGLGCRLGAYEVGVYKNSYSDVTAYAVRDWTHSSGLGVFAGIATGYQDDAAVSDHGVTVLGGAVYRGDYATIRVAPTYAKDTSAAGAVISLSFTFGDGQ